MRAGFSLLGALTAHVHDHSAPLRDAAALPPLVAIAYGHPGWCRRDHRMEWSLVVKSEL